MILIITTSMEEAKEKLTKEMEDKMKEDAEEMNEGNNNNVVRRASTRVDEELDGKYFALAEMLKSIGKDIEKIKDEEGLS